MAKLRVTEICGHSRVSREDGAQLRSAIDRHWADIDPIHVDFENVTIASASFLDESIASLGLAYSLGEIQQRLVLVNMPGPDRKLLNDLLLRRSKEREQALRP